MRSTERLVAALIAAGAPQELVDRAKRDEFHDFKSESATPCMDLAAALWAVIQADPGNVELMRVRRRAIAGEFDATREESDEWAASPEGRAAFAELGIRPDNRRTP